MSEYIVDFGNAVKEYMAFFGERMARFVMGNPIREEIVRCRDCAKWHHIDTEDGVRYGECDEWKRADSYCVPATNEDGFCAWASAARRVDNAD